MPRCGRALWRSPPATGAARTIGSRRVTLNAWRRRVERFRWSGRDTAPASADHGPAWVKASGLALAVEDRGATWRAHSWPYIHPVQDVAGKPSPPFEADLPHCPPLVAEASGEDAETVLREIAADNALADELGLRLDSDGRGKVTA